MHHATITKIGTQHWQCDHCGTEGTFAELNNADNCPGTWPLDIEDCPTCGGTGQVANWLLAGDDGQTGNVECPRCDGCGMVKSNQILQNGNA